MADTTFVSQVTRILASWLNDVNAAVYRGNSGLSGVTAAMYRTALARNAEVVYVKDFGAVGNGVTDDTTAFGLAITYCQNNGKRTLILGPGDFLISSTITISGANKGITIIGSYGQAMQQGSALPETMITYTGSGALFDVQITYTQFRDFAVRNTGTGTIAFKFGTSVGRVLLDRISANIDNSTLKRWSDAVIKFTAPADYSYINQLESASGAPTIIKFDQGSPVSATTRFHISNCTVDASLEDMKFLELINGGIETLSIEKCTFNTQPYLAVEADLLVVDASAIGVGYQVDTFNYQSNEYDSATTGTTGPVFDLVRFRNAWMKNNQFHGNGVLVSLVKLTDSTLFWGANTTRSISGPLISTIDSTSLAFFDRSYNAAFNTNNAGLVTNATSPTGIVDITYATTMYLHGESGNPSGPTTYQITATDAVAFTINYAVEANSPPNNGYMTRGQIVTVKIKNSHSAALGAVTWGSTQFTLRSPWVQPPVGVEYCITFVQEASKLVETGRVPQAPILYRSTTVVGNVGGGTDTLMTYSLPANSLVADGQGVRITAWGTTANNSNPKTVVLLFGAAVITTALTISQVGVWRIVVEVLRTGSSTQAYDAQLTQGGATTIVDVEQGTLARTDTAVIVISCTGTVTDGGGGINNDDISQKGMIVEWLHG